ncbi:hypothetical protein TNCV_1626701 [Trichonephila clavipes]|nr:hypothetical protein TNCV_1626701 [Trichonephila clavipes]
MPDVSRTRPNSGKGGQVTNSVREKQFRLTMKPIQSCIAGVKSLAHLAFFQRSKDVIVAKRQIWTAYPVAKTPVIGVPAGQGRFKVCPGKLDPGLSLDRDLVSFSTLPQSSILIITDYGNLKKDNIFLLSHNCSQRIFKQKLLVILKDNICKRLAPLSRAPRYVGAGGLSFYVTRVTFACSEMDVTPRKRSKIIALNERTSVTEIAIATRVGVGKSNISRILRTF